MINHQNFLTAFPTINDGSFDELGKFSTIPVKNTPGEFGTSLISINPNNEEWKNRLCENTNQAGINIGIPFICDPSNNTGQNGNNDQQNGNTNQQNGNTNQQNGNTNQLNQDITDDVNEKVGNLKEKLDD